MLLLKVAFIHFYKLSVVGSTPSSNNFVNNNLSFLLCGSSLRKEKKKGDKCTMLLWLSIPLLVQDFVVDDILFVFAFVQLKFKC